MSPCETQRERPVGFGGGWRGCAWRVVFHDCRTGRDATIHTRRPAFVCRDRHVVCTANDGDGRMNVSLTPVEQLVRMTRKP